MPSARRRQVGLALLKLGVTAALVYWLLANADFAAIRAMLTRVGWGLFAGAIALHLGTFFMTAARWWLLLRHADKKVSLRDILPSYYLGLFFNNLLPTSVGGDVVRAVHLSRRGVSMKALAASVIVDRALGLIVMLLIAALCATWAPRLGLDDKIRASALIVLVGGVIAVVIAFSPWAGVLLERLRKNFRNAKLRRGIVDALLLCYSYRSNPALLLSAALLSLIAQSLAISVFMVLGRGIGLEVAPALYFIIIPIVFIVAMLPISLGGLGVREGALVGLLIAFGTERQLAIGLSLLYLVTLWLSTLPGALALLAHGKTHNGSAIADGAKSK